MRDRQVDEQESIGRKVAYPNILGHPESWSPDQLSMKRRHVAAYRVWESGERLPQ